MASILGLLLLAVPAVLALLAAWGAVGLGRRIPAARGLPRVLLILGVMLLGLVVAGVVSGYVLLVTASHLLPPS